jgi:hypothetical protein
MSDVEDLEFDYIKAKLKPKLAGVEGAKDDLTFVTYQMYSMVKDAILEQIYASPAIWDDCSELALLGGVQINRFQGGDMFQPLMFQTVTKSGKTTDLYADTFGPMPQLAPVIGSAGITSTVLNGALKLNRKALVDRKVRPKLDKVDEKLKKVRDDIKRVENGYGGDLDKIAEELAELQDDMKFDELKKDMKILAGLRKTSFELLIRNTSLSLSNDISNV